LATYLAFVDDYSGLIMVYFLKMKSDTIKATEKFLSEVLAYGQVKRIRSDNGGEYTSTNFKNLLIKNKIKHEMSAPQSPHQNGTVERSWRSVFDMARCMLIESKLPKTMWKNAVMTTVYTRNRCYNPRLQKTAFEAFTGTKPNISNMHTFGTVCYAYVQNKKKLDPRSEKGIFIGYDRSSPAYLVYYPNSGETRKVRCVTFTKMKLDDESHNNEEDDGVILRRPADVCVPEAGAEGILAEAENVANRRYPARDQQQPKHLKDYVVGDDDDDDNLEDNVNYTVDYTL